MILESLSFSEEEITFFKNLEEKKVRFMVVGMSAAILQGVPVATMDIDLWFESYTALEVAQACKAAGGKFSWRSDPPMILGKGLEDLDVVVACQGLRSFLAEYQKSKIVPITRGSSTVTALHVLPLERVIESKKASGRAKDLAALPLLEESLSLLKSNFHRIHTGKK